MDDAMAIEIAIGVYGVEKTAHLGMGTEAAVPLEENESNHRVDLLFT